MPYDNYQSPNYRGKKNNGGGSKQPIRLTFLQLVLIVISSVWLGYFIHSSNGNEHIPEAPIIEPVFPTPTPVPTPEYEETPYPEVRPTP